MRVAIGDDGDLDIGRQADDLHGEEPFRGEERELRAFRFGEEDLGDGIGAGESNEGFGGAGGVEDTGFDVEFTGEVEVFFDRLALNGRE